MATLGGVWQAFSQGFCGVRAVADGLQVDPMLPDRWGTVVHRFVYRSTPVALTASKDTFTCEAVRPLPFLIGADQRVVRERVEAIRTSDGWEIQ